MDSFSGLESALKVLFCLFVVIIPAVVLGIGFFIGWLVWG